MLQLLVRGGFLKNLRKKKFFPFTESHGKDGTSPLEKCLNRARFIREQALTYSASAVFTDANRLLFGEGEGGCLDTCGNSKCLMFLIK